MVCDSGSEADAVAMVVPAAVFSAKEEAANELGVEMDKMQGREAFYGMPFEDWKANFQTEATPDQKAAFAKSHG